MRRKKGLKVDTSQHFTLVKCSLFTGAARLILFLPELLPAPVTLRSNPLRCPQLS